jgi:hypothetical protein
MPVLLGPGVFRSIELSLGYAQDRYQVSPSNLKTMIAAVEQPTRHLKRDHVKGRTFERSGSKKECVAQIQSLLEEDGIVVQSVNDLRPALPDIASTRALTLVIDVPEPLLAFLSKVDFVHSKE